MTSSLFNSVAGSYATTRPSYPPARYDAVAAAVGKPYEHLTVIVPEQSVPEAMRALKPDGVLAAWWNVPDFGVEWVAAQAQRLRRAAPKYHGFVGTDIGGRLDAPPFNLNTGHHTFPWDREVTIDQHVTMLGASPTWPPSCLAGYRQVVPLICRCDSS